MPVVAPIPSASETIAMAVTKGVLESVRIANFRLRIRGLDGAEVPRRLPDVRQHSYSDRQTECRSLESASSTTHSPPEGRSVVRDRHGVADLRRLVSNVGNRHAVRPLIRRAA